MRDIVPDLSCSECRSGDINPLTAVANVYVD